ncbi:hypothetical protein [Falsiroseomonas sp. HW251]|uniref:hypothetical protein n=1 Tax=Falsiroseomonas sp. HW251 TaxID=3390998 RepID=UPI003D31F7E5
MDITDDGLSARAIHAYITEKRRTQAEEARRQDEAARAERAKLRQHFMEQEVPADAMGQVARLVRRAVDAGEKRVLVLQCPSDWLPDQGRSISNHAGDWHEHLDGLAARAYAFYERELKKRGFQLQAEIISWPDGMPGDVGFFLHWHSPDEE